MSLIDILKADLNNPANPGKQYNAAYRLASVGEYDKPRAIRILLAASLKANDTKLLDTAVESLRRLAPTHALNIFIKATDNVDDPMQRRRAYYHIGSLGNESAINVVLKGLHDPVKQVRWAAVVSCGKLGREHRIIRMLEKLLNTHVSESMRKAIYKSIQQIYKRTKKEVSFNTPARKNGNNRGGFNRKNNFGKVIPKAYRPKAF